MNTVQAIPLADVEERNNALAARYDIDEYYANALFLIRMVEQARLRAIARMVEAKPSDRILEVGCGGGHVLRLFRESSLVGVDVSPRMLEKARRNLRGCQVELLKGELRDLALPDRSFDKIVCTEVLEHVNDPSEILSGIARLLKPHGRAVITFPNDRLVKALKKVIHSSRLDRLPWLDRLSWGGDEFHVHQWRIREMRALLRRFFTIRQERFVPFRLPASRCCFRCALPA